MTALDGHLPHLFTWLVRSTLQAGVVAILILAAQAAFGRRLSAGWRSSLWLLLVVRLLLPWSPESALSVFNLTKLVHRPAQEVVLDVGPSLAQAEGNPSALADTTGRSGPRGLTFASPVSVADGKAAGFGFSGASVRLSLAVVWLLGAIAFLGRVLLESLRLSGAVGKKVLVTDQAVLDVLEECKVTMDTHAYLAVVETRAVPSPSLFGFVRPRLVLPEGSTRRLTREELRFVFLHELGHLKRQDIALNWIVVALQAVHWFNPLVWYAFHRMRGDREVACDALVLSHTRPEERVSYGQAILSLLQKFTPPRRLSPVAGILEDHSQLKRRIHMIAQSGKQSWRWSVASAAVLVLLGCGTLTWSQGKSGTEQKMSSSTTVSVGDEQGAYKSAALEKKLKMPVSVSTSEPTPLADFLEILSFASGVKFTTVGDIKGDEISASFVDQPLRMILDNTLPPGGLRWACEKGDVIVVSADPRRAHAVEDPARVSNDPMKQAFGEDMDLGVAKDGAVDIKTDKDGKLDTMLAKRGVVLTSRKISIECDVMTYAPARDRLVATGHPIKILNKGVRATCENLVYSPKSGDAVLTGNPKAWQKTSAGKSSLVTGQTIVIEPLANGTHGIYVTNAGPASHPITRDASTENEQASDRKVDEIDYPFVDDPELIGTWESVDLVKEVDLFKPGEKQSRGDLAVKKMSVYPGGKTSLAFTWTKGLLLDTGAQTASEYVFKDFDGTRYMLMEYKNGDYILRGRKAHYLVLKQVSRKPEPRTERKVDRVDYLFVNDPDLVGRWESVDFVNEMDQFKPGEKRFRGEMYLKDLIVSAGGATSGPWTWTKGLLLDLGNTTASKYEIRNIGGTRYLLMEWKSGDYVLRGLKPGYYVLKAVPANLEAVGSAEK